MHEGSSRGRACHARERGGKVIPMQGYVISLLRFITAVLLPAGL